MVTQSAPWVMQWAFPLVQMVSLSDCSSALLLVHPLEPPLARQWALQWLPRWVLQ
jgi:hypothetical protein